MLDIYIIRFSVPYPFCYCFWGIQNQTLDMMEKKQPT